MFGWFRKRSRPEAPAAEATAEHTSAHDAALQAPPAEPSTSNGDLRAAVNPATADAIDPAVEAPSHDAALDASIPAGGSAPAPAAPAAPASSAPTPSPTSPAASVSSVDTVAHAAPPAAPSLRPAMPLSDHPNFAGLGLAQPEAAMPRLLEPEAALTDAARDELTALLLDMFGPRGRYRLEWRPDRELGDDAMFSEIMVADLVRRIQNSIAASSDLELQAAPLRLAIEAMRDRTSGDDDDRSGDDQSGHDPSGDASEQSAREQSDDASAETSTDSSPPSASAEAEAQHDTAAPAPTPARTETAAFDTEQRVSAASVVDHRSSAISAFLTPRDDQDDLATLATPERRRTQRPLDIEDDRAIA